MFYYNIAERKKRCSVVRRDRLIRPVNIGKEMPLLKKTVLRTVESKDTKATRNGAFLCAWHFDCHAHLVWHVHCTCVKA